MFLNIHEIHNFITQVHSFTFFVIIIHCENKYFLIHDVVFRSYIINRIILKIHNTLIFGIKIQTLESGILTSHHRPEIKCRLDKTLI